MKSFPVGADLFHSNRKKVDGRTDMTKPTDAFRHFANGSKNENKQKIQNISFQSVVINLNLIPSQG